VVAVVAAGALRLVLLVDRMPPHGLLLMAAPLPRLLLLLVLMLLLLLLPLRAVARLVLQLLLMLRPDEQQKDHQSGRVLGARGGRQQPKFPL